MSVLEAVLREIDDGRASFEPVSKSDAGMIDLQPIAKALVFADGEGYLDGFLPHKESQTGNRWYVQILITNGLSHKGSLFLAAPTQKTEESLASAIQLKPSIYGIGVDLNALWAKWKARKA